MEAGATNIRISAPLCAVLLQVTGSAFDPRPGYSIQHPPIRLLIWNNDLDSLNLLCAFQRDTDDIVCLHIYHKCESFLRYNCLFREYRKCFLTLCWEVAAATKLWSSLVGLVYLAWESGGDLLCLPSARIFSYTVLVYRRRRGNLISAGFTNIGAESTSPSASPLWQQRVQFPQEDLKNTSVQCLYCS